MVCFYLHSLCSAALRSIPAMDGHPFVQNKHISIVKWGVVKFNLQEKINRTHSIDEPFIVSAAWQP